MTLYSFLTNYIADALSFSTRDLILYIPLGTGLFFFNTLCFDGIHHLLHIFTRSRFKFIKLIGNLHTPHHIYLDEKLDFNDDVMLVNYVQHHLPEFFVQIGVCALVGGLFMPPSVTVGVLIVHTILFIMVSILKGKDANHRSYTKLPAPLHSIMVGPRYHAMHHLYPDHYFGSLITLYDRVMGTGCPLAGKNVIMTGASGSFGKAMQQILKNQGCANLKTFKYKEDYTYDDYSKIEIAMQEADILVLAHGSKVIDAMDANCSSFVSLIEAFKKATQDRLKPPEVWALGSEIEAHPHFGNVELQIYSESKRAYAKHAWRYYRDPSIFYRHIVCSAFTSPMGPGLISGKMAAHWAFFYIRRGFQYIPVSYTGIAFLNWLKFLLPFKAATAPTGSVDRVTAENDPPMEYQRLTA